MSNILNTRQPIIKMSISVLERILNFLSLIGVIIYALLLIYAWPLLPDTIPTHFNAMGEVDGMGNKYTLLLLGAISLIIYVSFTILRHYSHLFNYSYKITAENAEQQYRVAINLLACLKIEIVYLFLYIEYKSIQVALGKVQGLGIYFLPVVLTVIFVTIMVYLTYSYRTK